MNILVTGAKGFVGRNLCAALNCVKDGKDRSRHGLSAEMIGEVMEYDIDTDPALLDEFCAKADFVFNLAGVNRPKDPAEFQKGNFGFASTLLETLKKHNNKDTKIDGATEEGRTVFLMSKLIESKKAFPIPALFLQSCPRVFAR